MSFETLITKELNINEKLKAKENFSFSRFGDGEWNCLLGKQGQNCDAHKYFPALGKALRNVLEASPEYYIGLQTLAYRQQPETIEQITKDLKLSWCKSDMLHHMSIKQGLDSFFDALDQRRVVLVGPPRLRQLKIYDDFVSIPEVNCWNDYERIKQVLLSTICKDDVVLYCASMMTNVLIHDLKAENITQVDCGSVFEPYIGHANRSYHANKINELNNKQ